MTIDALDDAIDQRGARAVVDDAVERTGRPLDLRALARRKAPPREWAIDQWMPRKGTVLLAGPGGGGKSLLAQQAATAQALGRDFIGVIPQWANVMFWNCEDDDEELHRRQESISDYFGVPLDEPAGRLSLVSRVGLENTLMAPVVRTGELACTNVFEQLAQEVNDLGIESLWLDNIAHVFGGNPDDRHQVTGFINRMFGMVRDRPFSLTLVTHTARAAGSEFANSAAWENACRVRWYFGPKLPDQKEDEEAPDSAVRYLARRKANYSARDHLRMTWRDGALVPDAAPSHVGGLVAAMDMRKAEEVALAAFRSLQGMGIKPSDGKTSQDFLPRLAVEKGLAAGYTRHDVQRAMDRLMTAGVFVRGQVGHYANRSPRMGLLLRQGGES